jgi:hypothetical protein
MKMTRIMTTIVSGLLIVNTSKGQIPTCPLKVGNTEVYSRNSILGDKVCPALSSLQTAASNLGNSVETKLNEITGSVQQFTSTILDGAINQDAIDKYNSAVNLIEGIKTELMNMAKDKNCGIPAVYTAMETSFKRTGEDIKAISDISGKFVNALGKLKPILNEAKNVVEQTSQILASIKVKTPELQKHIDVLEGAVNGIIADLTELTKLDATTFIETGKTLATGLVPYVGNCGMCAAAIATAITGMGEVGGGAAGGTAASETGIGAAIGAVVAAVGTVQTTVGSVLSSVPCKYVFDNTNNLIQYLKDLEEFVESVSKLATSIGKHSQKVIDASKALVEIGKVLGTENAPRIESIRKSFVNIAGDITETVQVIEDEVAPRVTKFIGNKIQQLSSDVIQLQTCYIKMQETFGWMTNDVKNAALNFGQAVTGMVDVGRVVDNIKTQLGKVKDEAIKEIKKRWSDLNEDKNRFITALMGSKPNDLSAVAAHVLTLIPNIDDLINMGKNLVSAVTGLIGSSVEAGKRTFVTQINQQAQTAKDTYNSIKNKSKSAATEIAFEKIKNESIVKIRRSSLNNLMAKTGNTKTIKPMIPVQAFKNLKLQVSNMVLVK